MGDLIKIGDFSEFTLCQICRKRQATILCDMPTGKIKNLHLRLPDGTTDYENSFKEESSTCDRHVCDKCCKEVGYDRHICKLCIEKLKE